MIDSAVALLRERGVAHEHIHADRFITRHGPLAAGVSPNITTTREATMNALHYLKFFLFHAIGLLAVVAILAGGAWVTFGLLGVLAIYLIGDAVCGDDAARRASSTPASSPSSCGWPCRCWPASSSRRCGASTPATSSASAPRSAG